MNALFKALSHPARRRILVMLREGPMSSGDIAAAFDMAWPSITAHLTALKDAGLVDAERDGTSIRYRLVISAAEEAAAFLMELMGAADKASAPVNEGERPNERPKKSTTVRHLRRHHGRIRGPAGGGCA